MNYEDFIKSKVNKIQDSGFEMNDNELNKNLFDFQKHIVKLALKKGRYAIFADTGLGKTIMQLEWAYQVKIKTQSPVLILAPLAVSGQTINEGKKFGYEIEKLKSDVSGIGIFITNYEQLDNIDCSRFSGVVLDESSILKNFTGKIKNKIIDSFKNTPYKLACTATPSPNDLNEIGNHSHFLNILDTQDMRSKWFVRDEGMNNYRLKGHAKEDFYGWVSSWASMLKNPSDLGFVESGINFKLPELNYFEYEIQSEKLDNGLLLNEMSVNATNFNQELKRTIVQRVSKAIDIVQNTKDYILIWVNRNDEADAIVKALKKIGESFAEVRGSEKTDIKENKLLGFSKKEFRILVTKKKIAQFGLNYQHCNTQIFLGLDFSFEGLYQAIRRSYRFGQKNNVGIHIITTDTMQNVMVNINNKRKQFEELQNSMNNHINENKYGLIMNYDYREVKNRYYHYMNGDSVKEIDRLKDNSIHFSVFSPPFSNLFTYSNSIRDMGNSENDKEFFKQTDYLLKKLFKKIMPGRLVAVHTKDLAVYKGASGYTGLKDFTGMYHRSMEKAGFKYHSKITIWTDPVLEMQRTKTQRLLYKQLRSDSSLTGVGLPEYVTLFKKWEGIGEKNENPVNNKNFDNFDLNTWQQWASPIWGNKIPKKDLQELINYYCELNGIINFEEIKNFDPEWLTGSWFDIRRTDVLNNKEGTAQGDEKHICPLQLSVIKRAIQMWTNPGEIVFSPFAGIGSELNEAIKLDRYAIGIELKPSYFDTGIKNCNNAIYNKTIPTLF